MKRLAIVGVAVVASILVVVFAWPSLNGFKSRAQGRDPSGNDLHAGGLAKMLLSRRDVTWETHALASGHLHFAAASHAARNTSAAVAEVDRARARATSALGIQDDAPIEVFLVESRDIMRELVGRPIGGMVQAGERTTILVHSATYTPLLVHELTHLFSHDHWGPVNGGRWMSEGLATLVNGDCQGHSIMQLAKGLQEDGKLRPWAELTRDFNQIDEITGNVQAASMLEFIMTDFGIATIRDMWRGDGLTTLERRSTRALGEMEETWLRRVRAANMNAARFDLPELRNHGCTGSLAVR
jgi:hypothetical protein